MGKRIGLIVLKFIGFMAMMIGGLSIDDGNVIVSVIIVAIGAAIMCFAIRMEDKDDRYMG